MCGANRANGRHYIICRIEEFEEDVSLVAMEKLKKILWMKQM